MFRLNILESILFLKSPVAATCPNCERESFCKPIDDKDIEKESLPIIKPEDLPPVKGYKPSPRFITSLSIIFLPIILLILVWLIIKTIFRLTGISF
jgi:hypothetical protein